MQLIHARNKARHSEGDEARAIVNAMEMWRFTPVWIPVVYGGRVLGHARGRQDGMFVEWSAGQGYPYNDYDQAISNKSRERHYALYYVKPISTSTVVHNWYDMWGCQGNPQRGDWSGTARTARLFTNSTTGAPYHGGGVTPFTKYITRASTMATASAIKGMLLYDRVISYDASTMTASSQTMTNSVAATRYINTSDPGLQIFIEADTVHGSATANLTALTYTNIAGTHGQSMSTARTLPKIISIAAPTTVIGARSTIQEPGPVTTVSLQSIYLPLAVGDVGVQKVESYTWSAAPTGTNSFVLQFPIALFSDTVTQGYASDVDMLSGIDNFNKRIYDDACLSWMINMNTSAQPSHSHTWMEFGWS